MPDVTASYGKFINFIAFLGILIHYQQPFMSEKLYFHQIFTDSVSDYCIHFASYGRFSDIMRFKVIFIKYYMFETWLVHQTFTDCVLVKTEM